MKYAKLMSSINQITMSVGVTTATFLHQLDATVHELRTQSVPKVPFLLDAFTLCVHTCNDL